MAARPRFPDFQPLTMAARPLVTETLEAFQPATSELSFTNLFIWRHYFQTRWCYSGDHLLIVFAGHHEGACALEPVGPGDRAVVCRDLLSWLAAQPACDRPRLERVGQRLADELSRDPAFELSATREHFDYVYRSSDLSGLKGKRYHAKRNHINRFRRNRAFEYRALQADHITSCLELAELWCGVRACEEDMSLSGEWEAVRQLFTHHEQLGLTGAVVTIEGRVQAFSMADKLNRSTAVVHVEKANPEFPELYTLINQQFAENAWGKVEWINREQDLGEAGLRKAKQSYHPDHLVPKYRVQLA